MNVCVCWNFHRANINLHSAVDSYRIYSFPISFFLLIVTPGFTANEYIQRRKNLVDMLPEHSCAVIAGHPLQIMSADIPYRFRQNSDFSYLCGFQEPDAVLILRKWHYKHTQGCWSIASFDLHDIPFRLTRTCGTVYSDLDCSTERLAQVWMASWLVEKHVDNDMNNTNIFFRREMWDGPRAGVAAAQQVFGADRVYN